MMRSACSSSTCGSPPRAWGQSDDRLPHRRHQRFTPTGVGTIPTPDLSTSKTPVHPHGRGDNYGYTGFRCGKVGSPPRAWGQYFPDCQVVAETRFTPTGVGTIARAAARLIARPVHPHGRGDNAYQAGAGGTHNGSPPRAWGQCNKRILPDTRLLAGSPPRAWGQSFAAGALWRATRFTPTGVGTIAGPQTAPLKTSVHPHGHGDNSHHNRIGCLSRSSPPQAWGQCK